MGEKPRRRPKLGVVGDPEVLSVWGGSRGDGTAEELKAALFPWWRPVVVCWPARLGSGATLDWERALRSSQTGEPVDAVVHEELLDGRPHEALRAGTDGTLAKVAWHQIWEAMEVSRVGPEARALWVR